MELKIENADIGYTSIKLIEKVNMTISNGEIILLMGNNGMGKSTFIKSLLHQTPLLSGHIFLNNQNINQLSHLDLAKKIAVVFSKKNRPHHYTTFDLISLGRYIHYPYYFELTKEDKALINSIITKLELETYKDTPLEFLSDGNLQKAYIARALVQESPIIILDEPTSHLDETNKVMIYKVLRSLALENNKIILFSSHDWRLAKEFCTSIAYIKDKKIQIGSVKEIISTNEELYLPIKF